MDVRELFGVISTELGVPESSLEQFIVKLEQEYILKAEQLKKFTETDLKNLGLPLGIAIKIVEILERSVNRKIPAANPRLAKRVISGGGLAAMSPRHCDNIALTEKQEKLIQQTWLKISLQSTKLRRYFHTALFKRHHELVSGEESKINTGEMLELIITNLKDEEIVLKTVKNMKRQYTEIGLTATHYPAFVTSLLGAIEKLTRRFGSEEDINDEFHSTWETFIDRVVCMMYGSSGSDSDSESFPSPMLSTSAPKGPRDRRSVMRKRSETLGALPLERSGKTAPKTPETKRKNSESSPKLFRVRSFKKKTRRNTLSQAIDVRKSISAAQESWMVLQPYMKDVTAYLFMTLQKVELFSFAHHILVENQINHFIKYISEWVSLAQEIKEDPSEWALETSFEIGIQSMLSFPITRTIVDEFVNVFQAAVKKKAKKIWSPIVCEHIFSLCELWFRAFERLTAPDESKIADKETVALLKHSWKEVNLNTKKQTHKTFTDIFFRKMFETAPHLRPLYLTSLDTQGKKLMDAITHLLDIIGDSVSFRMTLEDLGARHRSYRVAPSMFPIFIESFIYALEQTLADTWNADTRKLWIHFLGTIQQIMTTKMNEFDEGSLPTPQETVDARVCAASQKNSTELNLCNHKLIAFPYLPSLSHIQQLILLNNNISVIPTTVGELTNLELLDISKNKVKTIPSEIKYLKKLNRLYLGHNIIKELPVEFGALSELRKLSLTNNKLKKLPVSFYGLRRLTSLDLSNNKLKALPWPLYLIIDNLSELNITGNPLKLPSQQTNAIKESIHKSHFVGEASADTLKFALLGCEGAGKTSLLASLKGDTLSAPPLSTDGIEISEWDCGDVKLSCLDFAGQEVYYDNHTLFLSPNAIHVLVFNMCESVQQALTYWLKTLAAVSPNAPILLVGTRADNKDSIVYPSELAKDLAMEIGTKNLIGTFEVSSTKGTNIDKLRKVLVRLSTRLRQQLPKVPQNFIRLKEIIIQSRRLHFPPVFSWLDFTEICERCFIEDRWDALDFLQQQGIVMCLASREDAATTHSSTQQPNSFIVLDPSWLTEVTSSLYSFSHSFGKSDGFLSQSQLSQIWRTKNYSEGIHPYLTLLLENFDIIQRIDGGKKILLPSFLPENPPSTVPQLWTDSSVHSNYYRRRFKLKFAPNGFFVRCLLRLLQFGEKDYTMWRSGIYWKESPIPPHQQEILIVFTSESSTIDIFASVNDQSESVAMYLISQIIESSIHSLFGEDDESALVPLSGNVVVSVSRLENLMLKGGTDYIGDDGYVYPLHSLYPDGYVSILRKFSVEELASIQWELITSGSQASVECGADANGEKIARKNFLQGVNSDKKRVKNVNLSALHILQREAWCMSMCRHPCVVEVKGMCIEKLCLLMELAPSGDLYTLLYSTTNEYSWEFAIRIAMNIASAMNHLHSHSPPLLHRDIKSPNILLWSTSLENKPDDFIVAKLADLGLMSVSTVTHLSQAENPAWTAPEVMRGSSFTAKSDVYSFAMVLYELFFRKFPFSEYKFKFVYQQMDTICKDKCRPTIPAATPQPVRQLIECCWGDDQNLRCSFGQIYKRLESINEQKGSFIPLRELQK